MGILNLSSYGAFHTIEKKEKSPYNSSAEWEIYFAPHTVNVTVETKVLKQGLSLLYASTLFSPTYPAFAGKVLV